MSTVVSTTGVPEVPQIPQMLGSSSLALVWLTECLLNSSYMQEPWPLRTQREMRTGLLLSKTQH